MSAKLTTQEFIDRARAVHGDKYGYAFSVYQSARQKVIIKCPEHGIFNQVPVSHLSGRGCPKCSSNFSDTVNSFIEKAKCVHGCKYDYSFVEYLNSKTKVIIVCQRHGSFDQTPSNHLLGQGCPKCGTENASSSTKSNVIDFIRKSEITHDDKYDYSEVNYLNANTKVKIKCKNHGFFTQTPNSHLNGRGCPNCGGKIIHTINSFIKQAKSVHGDKYDYSDVKYKNAKTKVKITCKTHGSFFQTPHNHCRGNGCPGCASYGFDVTKPAFLYVLRSCCGRYAKIGITNDPKRRHTKLRKDTPFKFSCVELINGTGEKIASTEKMLLSQYHRVDFNETFDGHTEWVLWDDSIRHKLISFMNKELTNGPV